MPSTRQLAMFPVTADEDGDQLDLVEEVAKLHDVPADHVAFIREQARQAEQRDAADRAEQGRQLAERMAGTAPKPPLPHDGWHRWSEEGPFWMRSLSDHS